MGGEEKEGDSKPDDANSLAQFKEIIPNQSCLGSTITLAHHEEATPAQIQLGDSGKDSLGVYSSPRDPGLDLAAAKDQEDEGKMGDLEEVE